MPSALVSQGPLDQVQSSHFLIPGASLYFPNLGEPHLSNWNFEPVQRSYPRLWTLYLPRGAPGTLAAPCSDMRPGVDAVCQASGSWRVKRDSCILFCSWPELCRQNLRDNRQFLPCCQLKAPTVPGDSGQEQGRGEHRGMTLLRV